MQNGITYIAQVLKRNRTLKVLNLSDNRIDAAGLASLAEALKYNSTLETLELSSNPCCGPSSEGVSPAMERADISDRGPAHSFHRQYLIETTIPLRYRSGRPMARFLSPNSYPNPSHYFTLTSPPTLKCAPLVSLPSRSASDPTT